MSKSKELTINQDIKNQNTKNKKSKINRDLLVSKSAPLTILIDDKSLILLSTVIH